MKNLLNVKKVATHDGIFHADEVTGWVLIKELYPNAELVRTRDKDIIASCDLCFDVGGEDAKFDHHKVNREQRGNGIFYSGVGLLWREFGENIIRQYAPDFNEEEVKTTVQRFDEKFLTAICAEDNGQKLYESEYRVKTYSNIINDFNPMPNEDISVTDAFYEAVSFATFIFKKELKKAISHIKSKVIIKEYLDNREIPEVLVLNEFISWKQQLFELDTEKEVLYVIYPTTEGTYMIQAMSKEVTSFENLKDLPAEWGGKRDKELESITGVEGSIFCHANLFIAGATTLKSAIKLAKIAVAGVNKSETIICPIFNKKGLKGDSDCGKCLNYKKCVSDGIVPF